MKGGQFISNLVGAEDKTRTCTGLPLPVFETDANQAHREDEISRISVVLYDKPMGLPVGVGVFSGISLGWAYLNGLNGNWFWDIGHYGIIIMQS